MSAGEEMVRERLDRIIARTEIARQQQCIHASAFALCHPLEPLRELVRQQDRVALFRSPRARLRNRLVLAGHRLRVPQRGIASSSSSGSFGCGSWPCSGSWPSLYELAQAVGVSHVELAQPEKKDSRGDRRVPSRGLRTEEGTGAGPEKGELFSILVRH